MPFQAEANLFSLILGNQASADSTLSTENLQTMPILQANASSAIQDKSSDTGIKNDVKVSIVSDNALLPATSLANPSGEALDSDSSFDQMSVYVVRSGDTLSQIADMYDVSTNTILWANDMKRGDVIKEGDVLLILPVSGVKHTVTKGETLKSIAKKFSAEVSDIASFNGMTENAKLSVGDELIIPDGEMYIDNPTPSSSGSKKTPTPKTPSRNLAGYFINPAPGSIRTQSIHGKNAVDLAGPIGSRILAAASGTVLIARNGWNGGYGNFVMIQHPNGTRTVYAHLSKLATSTGASVSQGQLIGYMGNSGHVRASPGGTGSHLHFEVYGAKNPGANRSWKY